MVRIKYFSQKLIQAKTVFLDSMVFIYLLEKNETYFPFVEIIFEQLEKQEISAFTSIISPLEVLSTVKLKNDEERTSLYVRFFKEETNLTGVNLDWSVMEKAADLRRTFGIKTPDSIQLATAKISKVPLFITNDESFKKISRTKDLPEIFLLSSF